jgi:hypothetical protein
MRAFALLLVVSATLLGGCRDSLFVDMPPAVPGPENGLRPLYIKGVRPSVNIGETMSLRIERHEDAASYAWSIDGTGAVEQAGGATQRDRLVRGRQAGAMVVEAYALDENGAVLGAGRGTFVIER